MIYERNEATGVTVEDDERHAGSVKIRFPHNDWQSTLLTEVTPEKAESLLIGLLRWKLETTHGDAGMQNRLEGLISYMSDSTGWYDERGR
jgi:hypothetical protein